MNSELEHFFNTSLNEQQRKAALQKNGALLVLAGAGSGKTRVIIARIVSLLSQSVPSWSIIALTFTNKAAQEMKARIQHFFPAGTVLPFVGTFHSYCLRILRERYYHLELPAFSIMDESDKEKIIRRILDRNNVSKQITTRHVIARLSSISLGISDNNQSSFSMPTLTVLNEICHEFGKEKESSNCLDFDDLLHKACQHFNTDNTFKNLHQNRIKHILVDEYQDTNMVQHTLLKHMVFNHDRFAIDSLCAVGDEDQSIYSWRGATVTNILEFQKDFANTTVIKVEQNYRSSQPIVNLANKIISNNTERNSKVVWSEKKGHDRIRLLACKTEREEADALAECITAFLKIKKTGSIAVLYRTHSQSRIVEEALIKRTIPYKIVGGTQFYDRKEIKDILAYLRLIANPRDRVSLMRILNVPARGLGEKLQEAWLDAWEKSPDTPFYNVATLLFNSDTCNIPTLKRQSILDFLALFKDLSGTISPTHAIEAIISRTKYGEYLKSEYDKSEAEERFANVKELLSAAYHVQGKVDTIEEFLQEVALLQEQIKPAAHNATHQVLLMSLHAAKGLEFDMVLLSGLEDGVIPSHRSIFDPNALEEERRLLYVGITRARDYLLITHALERRTFGRITDQLPSRFLHEMRPDVMSEKLPPYYNSSTLRPYFNAWLDR